MGKILSFFKVPAILGLIFSIHSALAYEFSVTNATGEDIAIDIYGVPFGSMMRGAFSKNGLLPTQKYWERDFGKTRTINNAGAIDRPYIIPRGHTVTFNFTNWDIGVCFALDQIKVGRSSNGYNMTPAKVVALPNEWYDAIFTSTQKAGDTVEGFGKAVSEVGSQIPEPRAQAVVSAIGAGTAAVGALTDVVGKLIRASSCKNMSFVAVQGADGFSVDLLTQQQ
jgi:hypothetical protein